MIELITVIVLIGVLGGIGAMRFFDNTVFESRAYSDQSKSLIRYAQKLAIAQNRNVFVRSTPAGFAVCFTDKCSAANELAIASGGTNSGNSATRAFCQVGTYVDTWLCEGAPSTVTVTNEATRNEFGAAGYFSFDSMGRPHNQDGTAFARMKLTFASGTNSFALMIEPETGYVYDTTP